MKKPVYYLICGDRDSVTFPIDRYEDKATVESVCKASQNEEKAYLRLFYVTANEYRRLTGRTASADYLREK